MKYGVYKKALFALLLVLGSFLVHTGTANAATEIDNSTGLYTAKYSVDGKKITTPVANEKTSDMAPAGAGAPTGDEDVI